MKGNLSKLSSWRVPWLWLTSSERDKTLRLSVPQKEVFNGWKRPAELIEELGRGSVTPDALKLPKTKVVMDLVQDITTDCSVIASICAAVARFERGHGCVRHPSVLLLRSTNRSS